MATKVFLSLFLACCLVVFNLRSGRRRRESSPPSSSLLEFGSGDVIVLFKDDNDDDNDDQQRRRHHQQQIHSGYLGATTKNDTIGFNNNTISPSSSNLNYTNPIINNNNVSSSHQYDVIIQREGIDFMMELMRGWFQQKRNLFCDLLDSHHQPNATITKSSTRILVNITYSCQELFTHPKAVGTGNFIYLIYGMKITARAYGNIDLSLQCPDAYERRHQLILPWLMGHYSFNAEASPSRTLSKETVCGVQNFDNLLAMGNNIISDIQNDLRRLAIEIVGIPPPHHSNHHPAKAYAEQYLWNNAATNLQTHYQIPTPTRTTPPLYPNTTIDDVIIHFRCGDLMSSGHSGFGFIKYKAFAKLISPEARSIGIVTQPFSTSNSTLANQQQQLRPKDSSSIKMERCRIVVLDFVDYLQERFPASNISIHNNQETIALTYARMIMANQTIVAISTFGVFPALATFGTGYIRKPDYKASPNQFLLRLMQQQQRKEATTTTHHDNVTTTKDNDNILIENNSNNSLVLFKAKQRLTAPRAKTMWEEDPTGKTIIDWFRKETDWTGQLIV